MTGNVFVAAWPDRVVAERLRFLAHHHYKNTEYAPHLRLEKPEKWHLTLCFLGPLSDTVIADLAIEVRRVVQQHQPMKVCLDALGQFKGGRVAWIGCGASSLALAELQLHLAKVLGGGESQSFIPHITLARANRIWPAPEVAVATIPWCIDRLTVTRSVSGAYKHYQWFALG